MNYQASSSWCSWKEGVNPTLTSKLGESRLPSRLLFFSLPRGVTLENWCLSGGADPRTLWISLMEDLILLGWVSTEDTPVELPSLQHSALIFSPYLVTHRLPSSSRKLLSPKCIHPEHLPPLPSVEVPTKGFQVPRRVFKHNLCLI